MLKYVKNKSDIFISQEKLECCARGERYIEFDFSEFAERIQYSFIRDYEGLYTYSDFLTQEREYQLYNPFEPISVTNSLTTTSNEFSWDTNSINSPVLNYTYNLERIND